jgi:hypothetical protein
MTHTTEELESRLDNMIEFVTDATGQVETGTLANLGTLDKDVTQLCNDVEASPPEVAQSVSAKMAEMVSKLEQLAQALKEYQDNIQGDEGGQE